MPQAGDLVYLKFTTFDATGLPTTLAGTPLVTFYKDASLTQSAPGASATYDFDSVTGLNHVTVDTGADGTFWSNGSHFVLVIAGGTVAGVSWVGRVVGSFDLADPAVALSAAGLDAVDCDGYNARQALAECLAMLTGKLSGLPAGPAIIRSADDTANRVSITFDADNNRTAVVLTPPA